MLMVRSTTSLGLVRFLSTSRLYAICNFGASLAGGSDFFLGGARAERFLERGQREDRERTERRQREDREKTDYASSPP